MNTPAKDGCSLCNNPLFVGRKCSNCGKLFEKAKGPLIADAGPWYVHSWGNDGIALQSDDFKHDVALVIDGDFGSKEEKRAYAEKLAVQLNAGIALLRE